MQLEGGLARVGEWGKRVRSSICAAGVRPRRGRLEVGEDTRKRQLQRRKIQVEMAMLLKSPKSAASRSLVLQRRRHPSRSKVLRRMSSMVVGQ